MCSRCRGCIIAHKAKAERCSTYQWTRDDSEQVVVVVVVVVVCVCVCVWVCVCVCVWPLSPRLNPITR